MHKKKLKYCCDIFRGVQINQKEKKGGNEESQKFYILNYDDISTNLSLKNTININLEESKEAVYINTDKKYKDIQVQNQDLIIPAKLVRHKPKIIDYQNNENLNLIYSFELFVIKVADKKELDPKFLFYLFNSDSMSDYLDNKAKEYNKGRSGNFNRITLQMLEEIEIEVLSIEEQRRIVKQVEKLNKLKFEVESNLKKIFTSN